MLHHLDSTSKPILTKVLKDIVRHNDSYHQVKVIFEDDSYLILSVEGDCCSSSYFYAIDFPDGWTPSQITNIEEDCVGCESEALAIKRATELMTDFSTEEQEIFDVVFATVLGEVRVRHINVSNGYYDGMTSFSEIVEKDSGVIATFGRS